MQGHLVKENGANSREVIMSNKYIAFSLWGDNPKYLLGAVENAKLAAEIYPGWKPVFFVHAGVEPRIVRYLERHSQVVLLTEAPDWTGMFWRFRIADFPDVSAFIVRDCDSRLGTREATLVQRWLDSPYAFHVIRDHPLHKFAILGGMWGAKGAAALGITEAERSYERQDRWGTDQDFLADWLWPRMHGRALIHDSIFGLDNICLPRQDFEFIGEPYISQYERDPHLWKHLRFMKIKKLLQPARYDWMPF